MITKINDFVTVSESLKYHVSNGIDIVANIYRHGSDAYIGCVRETRNLLDAGSIILEGVDNELYENTDIGRFEMCEGSEVPLDLPFESVYEAEYKGRDVELNVPRRGGTKKKYYVYVKNPDTGNVKKISFGDVHGGLTAKVSDPKARKSFAARHKCHLKKDKTTAGYWACRINRYAHLWNGNTYPGYW